MAESSAFKYTSYKSTPNDVLFYVSSTYASNNSNSGSKSVLSPRYNPETLLEARNKRIEILQKEIGTVIAQDEFIDGEISQSSLFIDNEFQNGEIEITLVALEQYLLNNYNNTHAVIGVLTMISSAPYDTVFPQGPIMAMGLLSHKELQIRDKAIQCFERWNSKKGLIALKSIQCSPRWLQRYVDQVIIDIEKGGIE